ncbi:MAG: AlpA family transcriptional regulator [Proteobacteria bacterium]|nr:AlpA family transcriptional regulator [Pseudomonadota bacterium]
MSQPIRMLRLPQVLKKTGLSRSQIYRLIALGNFPTQIQLSERISGWIEIEIDQWLQERIELSRERS